VSSPFAPLFQSFNAICFFLQLLLRPTSDPISLINDVAPVSLLFQVDATSELQQRCIRQFDALRMTGVRLFFGWKIRKMEARGKDGYVRLIKALRVLV